jgi:outer membrane immunogenic protein
MIRFLTTASVVVLGAVAFASQASAADLAASAPVYTKAPMVPQSNWTGWYIGGNVGGGWGSGNTDFGIAAMGGAPASLANSPSGVIGGGQFGYNAQFGATVLGFEADIQGSSIKGNGGPTPILDGAGAIFGASSVLTSSESLSWFGTVRGRLGVTATPSLLLFATGGLAFGQIDSNANKFFSAGNQAPASFSDTRIGWTAGAGAEWMFTRNWSAKLEYLYMDLGSGSTSTISTLGLPATYTSNLKENIVRVGVNYHFN